MPSDALIMLKATFTIGNSNMWFTDNSYLYLIWKSNIYWENIELGHSDLIDINIYDFDIIRNNDVTLRVGACINENGPTQYPTKARIIVLGALLNP